MTIGARLKEWRAAKNLQQKDVSTITGISFRTYQNYELDVSPPGAESLLKLIQAGINANWLMTGEGPMLLEDAKRLPTGLRIELDHIMAEGGDPAAAARRDADTRQLCTEFKEAQTLIDAMTAESRVSLPKKTHECLKALLWLAHEDYSELVRGAIEELSGYIDQLTLIPFYNVEASAGHGRVVDKEEQISQVAFRKDWIKSKGLQEDKLTVIKARGDSMEGTFWDGDILLVDTRAEKIEDDAIYVIHYDDHTFVKRLQLSVDGGVTIISDNERYERQRLTPEQAQKIHIGGRVFWYGHEI